MVSSKNNTACLCFLCTNAEQFTADVSHESRTPLAATQATVESALRLNTLSDFEARGILNLVGRQLVKDLLLLSRIDKQGLLLKSKECYLQDLVNDIAEEVAVLAMSIDMNLTT